MAMTLPHVMSLSEFVERTDDKTLGIFRKSRQQLRFIETLVDELVPPPTDFDRLRRTQAASRSGGVASGEAAGIG